ARPRCRPSAQSGEGGDAGVEKQVSGKQVSGRRCQVLGRPKADVSARRKLSPPTPLPPLPHSPIPRSIRIIDLAMISSQSIERNRLIGKVLSAWELASENWRSSRFILAKY